MQIQSIVPPIQLGNDIRTSTPVKSFTRGETINATVCAVSKDRVSLKLEDGTTLTASREGASTLRTGDTVMLQAGNTENGKPTLSLVSINEQPTVATATQTELMLLEMKLDPSAANVQHAQTLKNMALPVSTGTLTRLSTLTAAFPSLSPSHAALFASSSIPITQANVMGFEAWLSSPVNAGELANTLTALANSDPQFAEALNQILSQPTPGGEATAPTTQASSGEVVPVNVQGEAALAGSEAAQTAMPSESQGTSQPTQAAPFSGETAQPEGAVLARTPEIITGSQNPATPTRSLDAGGQGAESIAHQPQAQTAERPLPLDVANSAASTVKDASSEAAIQKSLSDILEGIFKPLDKSVLSERGSTVRETVTKLPESVLRLSEALSQASGKASLANAPARQTAALFSQLSMGAEMGTLIYTQIPLRAQDSHRSADLYVMKRNPSRSDIDPANATIAICLDTEHMGLVESLLHVEKNDLSLKLRVENERVKKYVEENLSRLYCMEFPSQYKFRFATVSLVETPITPATAAKEMTDAFSRGSILPGGLDIIV